MSLVRAIIITVWCVAVAVFHGLTLWAAGSQLLADPSRLTGVHPALGLLFAASALSLVAALIGIVAVKALWFVVAAAVLLLAGGVLAFVLFGYQFALNLAGVALIQFVLSWMIIALNRIDNPPRPTRNPAEVF